MNEDIDIIELHQRKYDIKLINNIIDLLTIHEYKEEYNRGIRNGKNINLHFQSRRLKYLKAAIELFDGSIRSMKKTTFFYIGCIKGIKDD